MGKIVDLRVNEVKIVKRRRNRIGNVIEKRKTLR